MANTVTRNPSLPDRWHSRDSRLFGRILALSNGVFGISLTLLVLNISVSEATQSGELSEALLGLTPNFIAFVVTVFVVSIYWKNHHFLFDSFRGIDAPLVGLNFAYLGLVALVPFPNELISSFQHDPWAYVAFGTLLTLLSAVDSAMYWHARRRGLLRPTVSDRTFYRESVRGAVTVGIFAVSIPLSFVLVSWTPIVWVLLLPIDRLLTAVLDDG